MIVAGATGLVALAALSVVAHRVAVGEKPPPYAAIYRNPATLASYDVVTEALAAHGPALPYVTKRGEIRPGDTFGGVMQAIGFNALFVERLGAALKGVFSFGKCRPGDLFEVRVDEGGGLMRFEYQASPTEVYVVERDDQGRFEAYREEFEEEVKVVWVAGRVESSLYDSVIAIKEDPELAVKMANEVFAWDIDFYSEAQKGDVFKIAVEKHYSGDYFVRYGRILAAEYAGAVGKKQSFLWRDPSAADGNKVLPSGQRDPTAADGNKVLPSGQRDPTGKDGYYNAQGIATKRVFLRSPLKFAHVTSKFGNRFHPVLKIWRPHHGVDYGAATGTPVWAVADGSVVSSGVMGGLGKAVKVQHAGGYTSLYGHLSKIGAGLGSGSRVRQGQVVGNVGSTGMSTGPHLHFTLMQYGAYINPLKRVAPPTEPIPAKYLGQFRQSIAPWVERLGEVPAPDVSAAPTPVPAAGNGGPVNFFLGGAGG